MTRATPPSTSPEVDAFLARLPEAQRVALEEVRTALHTLVPEATEVLSNGVPTLIHFGPLIGFGPHGASRTQCALYVMQAKLLASMRSAIAPHTVSGGTIVFTPEQPPSATLLERLARDRARENEAAHIRSAQRNAPKRK
ncbi:MAG: hypothetical protein WCI61_05670 [Chloroflexota bacterium]